MNEDLRPTHLRCEALSDPLGLDERQPELAWWPGQSERRGMRQTAYRIIVASTPEGLAADHGDLWDSGKTCGSQVMGIRYGGQSPASRQRCYWKVRTWTNCGASLWSEPAYWEMGLLAPTDWQGRWIAAPAAAAKDVARPCPHLRRVFRLDKPVAQARLYATALGLYEVWLNGRRIGDRVLTPGYTDYAKRRQYQVYDVTASVAEGANAIGAILADGWYSRGRQGKDLLLLAQLEIAHPDGSVTVVVTDGQWRSASGPLLQSDLDKGETYDERLEQDGWCCSEFDDGGWAPARAHDPGAASVVASVAPPVRRIQEIRPIKVAQAAPGRYIFDLGQNMVGRVRLHIPAGLPDGARLVTRHAEVLNPDGSLYTANLRSADSIDTFIVAGGKQRAREHEPRFTFHGFRYVEVDGLTSPPGPETVTGIVLHSDTPPTGTFACSNELLNQLQHNIVWSQKGNFIDVPTDCPQRDERVGWTGDAQVFIPTASFNMDVQAFFRKWGRDLLDAQQPNGTFPAIVPYPHWGPLDGGAAWADAGIVIPWTIYCRYGDRRMLAEHYSSMARYVEFLQATRPRTRECFGDWLNVNDGTGGELLAVACAARVIRLMERIAGVLDRPSDAQRFRMLADGFVKRFQREFVTPSGRVHSDSQTAYVLALAFDLLPPRLRPAAGDYLVERLNERGMHLSTGFVGAPHLLDALTKIGRLDLAYALLQETTFPSWLYPVTHGATTIWERWDGWHHERGFQDPGMNSFNHYAYGAVGDWMYRHIGGIQPDEQGAAGERVTIRPRPGGGLTWAKATLATHRGMLSTHWRWKDACFNLDVTIPPNTIATVRLPLPPDARVLESDRPLARDHGVSATRIANAEISIQIVPGTYAFAVEGVTQDGLSKQPRS